MEPGESAAVAFVRRTVTSNGRTLHLLVSRVAGEGAEGGGVLVSPAAPAAEQDAARRPVLSLTLVLDRAPGPGEPLAPLVRSGLLGLTLSLAIPPWALDALGEDGGVPSPLFARRARFELGPAGGAALASAEGIGAGARAALSAVLDAGTALRALGALRGEDDPGLEVRAVVTWRPPGDGALSTLSLSAPLAAALGAAAGSGGEPGAWPLDLDRHVRLVTLRGPDASPEELPALARETRPRDAPGPAATPRLAAVGGRLTSLGVALQPGGPAHLAPVQSLAASRPGAPGAFLLDDARLPDDGAGRALPVVQDPNAPLWPGRTDPRQRWYAPGLELVRPGPNDDPAASPFLFRWKQAGVTGGPHPEPGLEGSVTFTLRPVVPAAVRDALAAAGHPPVTAISLTGLQVALEIPFREEGTGATRTQLFPARVAPSGDTFVATVDLLDGWVRLCYGALAYPGFQARPARLRIGWSFDAFIALPGRFDVFGAQEARTPIGGRLAGRTSFEPGVNTLHTPGGEARFGTGLVVRRGPPLPLAHAVLLERPGAALPGRPVIIAAHVPTVARPEVVVNPALVDRLRLARYAIQTVIRGESLEALFPCRDFPSAYRRPDASGADAAAGCQDALRLGEIGYRQFEELPELRRDDAGGRLCTVYRSLQQPGRFLVAPARWRIARYAPTAGPERAWRPTALVYALHEEGAAGTRCLVSALLEPDLPLHVRRDLARQVAARTPAGHTPVIDYPTEQSLQATQALRWAIPAAFGTPETTATWNGFQVTLGVPLSDALLLVEAIERTGLAGEVTFTLPDGTALRGELRLDTCFTGPWATGPVEVTAEGARATLANRLEVPVDVSELWVDGARGTPVVPVDRTLAPGASLEVALPSPAADPCAVATPRPGAAPIAEAHVFVEDVTTNVILVNLVSYANHGIASLAVDLRLAGTEHVYGAELAEGQHATLELSLPLTTYVQARTLELRLRIVPVEGAPAATGWWSWDLEKQGNVVSVTQDLLPAARTGPVRAPGKGEAMKKKALKSEGPRGLSIHIGLNHVDAGAYDGWDGALSGCINDANAMERIARGIGYEPVEKLLDEQATADAVLEALGRAAQDLQAGDQLLLTYSGHGGQVPDDTGEEEDGKDETWVLYDRQLLDNELYAMWGQFAAGVRIFVLSDSCHSGTVVRMAKAKKDQQAVQQSRGKKGLAPAFRLMPYEKAEKNYKDGLARYRQLQWLTSGTRRRSADEVAASVLLISGCQDNQFSQDGAENGLFTETLLKVWDDGRYEGDYRDFYEQIRGEMPSEQTPNLYTTGAFDADFENARPFEIVGASAGEAGRGAGPSIAGPDTLKADDDPPTFRIDPKPLGYYVVEVATDPTFFFNGGGARTAANAYGSWADVHRSKRGTAPTFTLPAAAWQALKKARKLFYRMYATDQATGGWGTYRLVDGAAPIPVTPSRAIEAPVEPPPAEVTLPPPTAALAVMEQQAR